MNQQSEQSGTKSDTDLEAAAAESVGLESGEQATETVELTLEEQLAAALEEADKLRDASLRAVAEQENMRRRTQRDVQNARKFGSEKLLGELVAVVDSLEAALVNEDASGEGVQMTLDLLLKIFERNHVVALSPEGELFNPDLHQAMSMVPSEEVAANHVLQVIQKGYQLHDRLLRPAMVLVAKAPDAGEPNASSAPPSSG